MSASLQTKNYKLPFFAPADYTDWQAYNEAMGKIDTALKSNNTTAENINLEVEAIQTSIEKLTQAVTEDQQSIVNNAEEIRGLQSSVQLLNQTNVSQNNRLDAAEASITTLNRAMVWKPIYPDPGNPTIGYTTQNPPVIQKISSLSGILGKTPNQTGSNRIAIVSGKFTINNTITYPEYIGFSLSGIREEPDWTIVRAIGNATLNYISTKSNSIDTNMFISNKLLSQCVSGLYNNTIQFVVKVSTGELAQTLGNGINAVEVQMKAYIEYSV